MHEELQRRLDARRKSIPGVTGAFAGRYSDSAREEIFRQFDYLLDRDRTAGDLDAAQLAVDVIRDTVEQSLSTAHSRTARPATAHFCVSC